MCRIIKVIPLEDYVLEVQLDSGSSVRLHLRNRLGTVRFIAIADIELFGRARTDGDYIRWDDKVEISVREVFELAQKKWEI